MNAEKLKKLQEQVRIGGKGTARRKKKVRFLCANNLLFEIFVSVALIYTQLVCKYNAAAFFLMTNKFNKFSRMWKHFLQIYQSEQIVRI